MNSFLVKPIIKWHSPECFCEETLSLLRGKKVLLLLSQSGIGRMKLSDWIQKIDECSSLTWINDIPSNPTRLDLYHAMISCGQERPDVVLAIGGGSAIDLAKALIALWYIKEKPNYGYDEVVAAISKKEYLKKTTSILLYALPTTAGTGSEVTSWATIWDENYNAKYSIEAPWLYPTIAYMVPKYTTTLPRRLTLATGLDALCHAVEAYWSKATNPVIREISKASIRLIVEYLPKTMEEPNNVDLRAKMCLGSMFAGLSFSNTRTTACHSISYPLTMRFGMEHGFACAVSLAKVLEYNMQYIVELNDLLNALQVNDPDELQAWLDEISFGIVKLRLDSFGVGERDMEELVNLSFTQGRMDNNPRVFEQADVKKLLHSILT